MRNRFDQFAKAIIGDLLGPVARVESGREITGFSQVADLWVEPGSAGGKELARRGVLGRMLELGPCLVEPFSQAPRAQDVRSCMLKQHAISSEQVRAAARSAARDEGAEPLFPGLWVIAAGEPQSLMRAMALRPMKGWPRGFWESPAFYAFRLVVVSRLPRTPDTVFLRMLGRGTTRRHALRELGSRRRGSAWARDALRSVLLAFCREFAENQDDFPVEFQEEYMNYVQEIHAIYEDWERDVRNAGVKEGRKKGEKVGEKKGERKWRKEGLITALEALCTVLDIRLTARRRAQIARWDVARLEQAVNVLATSRRWPDA